MYLDFLDSIEFCLGIKFHGTALAIVEVSWKCMDLKKKSVELKIYLLIYVIPGKVYPVSVEIYEYHRS